MEIDGGRIRGEIYLPNLECLALLAEKKNESAGGDINIGMKIFRNAKNTEKISSIMYAVN